MRHIRSIARPHVVVIGAGWAGCAAAVSAAAAGARVTLLERTDMILGTGLVGGIIKNNGRFTALEELRAMGADLLLGAMESCVLHEGISFPGHKHASLYDVARIEPTIRELIAAMDIDLRLRSTCIGFTQEAGWVTRAHLQYGEVVEGHVHRCNWNRRPRSQLPNPSIRLCHVCSQVPHVWPTYQPNAQPE